LHQPDGEPLVEVTRGDIVESVHRIAACATDARGSVLLKIGNIDAPIFLRSTAKPFIAAAIMAAGAREAFGFEPQEIAVIAASHSGEPFHVAAVRSILRKIGMEESALQCGTHLPYNEAVARAMQRTGEAPTAVYNNCSGKHAGILALCKLMGADPATYLARENPAELRILELCARLSGDDASTWPVGVDGCGIPVYATPLRNAALSFARFAAPDGVDARDAAALVEVRDAMIAFPEYIAGTGEFDAALMHAGGGAIACKAGAEGVQGVAAIDAKLGYVGKVIDGASRGRAPSTVAALHALGVLDQEQVTKLAVFARPVVYNRAGIAVGQIRARNVAVEKARA
jgi:L-asparaginase II